MKRLTKKGLFLLPLLSLVLVSDLILQRVSAQGLCQGVGEAVR